MRQLLRILEKEIEHMASTAADLQTQVDRLAAAVAALKAQEPAPSLISQEQLDANVASVSDSAAKVESFNAGAAPAPVA